MLAQTHTYAHIHVDIRMHTHTYTHTHKHTHTNKHTHTHAHTHTPTHVICFRNSSRQKQITQSSMNRKNIVGEGSQLLEKEKDTLSPP